MDIISSILGHTDLKTTTIYTKYDDRERIEEMGKWNNESFNVSSKVRKVKNKAKIIPAIAPIAMPSV